MFSDGKSESLRKEDHGEGASERREEMMEKERYEGNEQ